MNKDLAKLFDPLHGALWSPRLLIPLGVAAGMSFLLFIIRGIVLRLLNKNRQGENSELSLFSVFRTPSLYWCVALGLYAGIALSELDSKYAHDLNQFVHVVMVLSLTLAAANVSAGVFKNIMVVADQGAQTSGLAVGVVKGAVHATGILIVLSMLGISIAPLLTALGVGGLAVALALKDTLENLFAGIYLITDKAIRVGDFVRLESGQEGNIEDIGWRTIRIRTLNNNIVILPNSKLAQSIVTNFSLPDRRISVSIPVTVKSGRRSGQGGSAASGYREQGQRGCGGPGGQPLSLRALQSRRGRELDGLHGWSAGRGVSGSVLRPARATQAHLQAPAGREDSDAQDGHWANGCAPASASLMADSRHGSPFCR